MQGTIRTGNLRAVECAGQPLHGSAAPVNDLVYDLRSGGERSDETYEDTARFSERLLSRIEDQARAVLDEYSNYVQEELREAARSRGEYALDLLTLGMATSQYWRAAQRTPGWAVALAEEFYWLRRSSKGMKWMADAGRALLWHLFSPSKTGRRQAPNPCTLKEVPDLIEWMQATGEFDQETRRLNNWRSFLNKAPAAEARHWMKLAVEAFDWFEREAAEALGKYTRGVQRFLDTEYARRGIREDGIFCGRPAVEYHLAMVATEVMNQGLRDAYERTHRRAVLVPACMRGAKASGCRAGVDGFDITCAGCDPDCAVHRITRKVRGQGGEVYMIPHASGFSRWLERWQREPDTGVLAVACLLNILPGGYEMRARRIPSQCVPLDYPGCAKHWRKAGIPTGVNEERLVRIAAARSS